MNKAFIAISAFAVLCLVAVNAELKVAIHKDSCNSASLEPAYTSRMSISQQLTVDGKISCEVVADSDFTQSNLARFDVIYLGCGGKDLDLDALSSSAAQAIVNFVQTKGGGLVLSATSVTAFSEVRSILEPVMPVAYASMAWAKNTNQNTVPLITIDNEAHYITKHALSTNIITPLTFAFYVQSSVKSGWTSLATTAANTAECWLGFSDMGDQYCQPYENQGLLVKNVGNGRVAYINLAFCGYEMFGPHNIRRGAINQLFLNMFYWSSGLCKNVNECNGHGACVGQDTCVCESGWGGSHCTEPSCSEPCANGGTCIAPNTCSCPEHFRPPDCVGCVYPYAGDNCNSYSKIQDPSFESDQTTSIWTFSDASVVVSSSGSVTPQDGSKMLAFTGSAKEFTVSQELYVMNSEEASPFLAFYYRTGTVGSSKLQIYVDDDKIWESSSSAVSSWTLVRKSLSEYASDDGERHIIKIKAIIADASNAFYVDLVEDGFPTCAQPCENGVCALNDDSSVSCHCDFYHSGEFCDKPRCGDGLIAYPEACDDGNDVSGDGCSSTCQVEDGWECEPTTDSHMSICIDICGDGRTMSSDPNACDDGNFIDGDGCSSNCKIERGYTCTQSKTKKSVCSIKCGDGLILGGEVCDVDLTEHPEHSGGCSSDCLTVTSGWDCTYNYNQFENDCMKEVCGDGHRTAHEQCDDGNKVNGDGCSSNCQIEKGWRLRYEGNERWPLSVMETRCGDDLTAGDEVCDGGWGCIESGRTGECTPEYGFNCSVDPVTLRSTCGVHCGDGIVLSLYEECDDGNSIDGDGCSSKCKLEPDYHCVDPNNCVAVAPNVCGDGVIHSPETCDISGHSSPGCVGCRLTPGWECDTTSCHTVCGDGILTEDEYCDCGGKNGKINPFCDEENGCENCKLSDDTKFVCRNVTVGNVIYSSCRSLCGNGIKTDNEECDDNNTIDGDGCNSRCKKETGWNCVTPDLNISVCTPICGDSLVVRGETCDEGRETNGCVNCQVQYGYTCDKSGHNCKCVHGDGKVCKEEDCDDGDPNSEACVDGKVKQGWECFNEDGKPSVCIEKKCGNGKLNSNEQCDDGNNVDGDGCSSDCKLEDPTKFQCIVSENRKTKTVCFPRVCGNGIITDDEECDDGDTKDGDGCSSKCVVEKYYFCVNKSQPSASECYHNAICGDGYRNSITEKCDDGNLIDGDGCDQNCTIEPGYVCVDEATEDGGLLSKCHVPVCGDGVREGEEDCDDGNTDNGDGCNYMCRIEPGFKCYENIDKKSTCRSFCGDGMKSATEECDDGNFIGGDGCSPTCKIEHGYSCFVNYTDPKCAKGECLSLCFATCGDGIVAQEEECDDGNSYQGDGCYKCKIEPGDWRCKGEPSECIMRKCTLPEPSVALTHILCAGSSTGVIDIYVNTTEEYVVKVWKQSTSEPSSYQSATHFTNLGAGTYAVKAALVGFMDCSQQVSVTIEEPPAFTGLSTSYQNGGIGWPSSCTTADGWIRWKPSGGVKPYKFYFANRTVSDSGNYDNVNITEFLTSVPSFVDANNCTKVLELTATDKKFLTDTNCETDTVPYLMEGSIALAAAFVVAIVVAISYSCWSSKRQVPKNWKGKK